MKILWWSVAPWCPTGYGQQTRAFLKPIERLGHSVTVASYRGVVDAVIPFEESIAVLPRGKAMYSEDVVPEYARRTSADCVISLVDVWALHPEALKAIPRWCPIVPIDTETLPDLIAKRLKEHAHMPIAMAQSGRAAMLAKDIDCRYVPHAYDPKAYYPEKQTEAREKLGWPQDRFYVSMVAGNYVGLGAPNRKCFSENLEAFARLKKKRSDAWLYLHTDPHTQDALGGGTDLIALLQHLGIADSTWFPDRLSYLLGALPQEHLRRVYSASDVLLAASAGEGFGVPIIEAQACGCPVIVGDWSAMSELVGGGWKIDKTEAHKCWTMFNEYWYLPSPAAIADRLERAYQSSRASRSTEAINFVKEYEVGNVVEKYWRPMLAEIEGNLPDPEFAREKVFLDGVKAGWDGAGQEVPA